MQFIVFSIFLNEYKYIHTYLKYLLNKYDIEIIDDLINYILSSIENSINYNIIINKKKN